MMNTQKSFGGRLRPKKEEPTSWENLVDLPNQKMAYIYQRLSSHEQKKNSIYSRMAQDALRALLSAAVKNWATLAMRISQLVHLVLQLGPCCGGEWRAVASGPDADVMCGGGSEKEWHRGRAIQPREDTQRKGERAESVRTRAAPSPSWIGYSVGGDRLQFASPQP